MRNTKQRSPRIGIMCAFGLTSYLITFVLWVGGVTLLRPGTIGWPQAIWVSLGVLVFVISLILISAFIGVSNQIWASLCITVPLGALAALIIVGLFTSNSFGVSRLLIDAIQILIIFGLPVLTWGSIWSIFHTRYYFKSVKKGKNFC